MVSQSEAVFTPKRTQPADVPKPAEVSGCDGESGGKVDVSKMEIQVLL